MTREELEKKALDYASDDSYAGHKYHAFTAGYLSGRNEAIDSVLSILNSNIVEGFMPSEKMDELVDMVEKLKI